MPFLLSSTFGAADGKLNAKIPMRSSDSVLASKALGRAESRLDSRTASTHGRQTDVQVVPQDSYVPQLVTARAADAPKTLALAAGSSSLTYEQLESRANRLAHHLGSLGVGPDVIVGVCLDRSIEFVVAALGVLKAGGAYLPLDPDLPQDRLAFMLEDCQASVLVGKRSQVEGMPAGRCGTVALDGDEARIADQPTTVPRCEVRPQDLAYVIYTSGSTGRPKGVAVTHGSLMNLVRWHQRAFGVTPADRTTQLANPGFDAAVWELWPHLAAGASVHLPDDSTRNAPELLRDWLVAHGITISFVPTALAERLLFLAWPCTAALRFLLTGADTLHCYPPAGAPFTLVNNYGPTECTVVATSGRVPPRERSEVLPSIGRPIDNVQVYILDEQLRPVPAGTPGEIYLGGAGLARGYINRPELTAERFLVDPFCETAGAKLYRTGDRARYLADGEIAFLGRIDDQIKIRGYRIEPDEIATVLNAYPGVRISVVAAKEESPGEKYLVAYLVADDDAELVSSAIRDFLRVRLPEYMIPTVFVRLGSLPLTPNGKVDRAVLPSPDPMNTVRDRVFVGPRNIVEERVAGILGDLLGLELVGVDDNFFLLGGHSLLGTQVIARVRDAFDIELPLRTLFDHPTVAGMSAEIERLVYAKLEAMSEEEVQRALNSTRSPR